MVRTQCLSDASYPLICPHPGVWPAFWTLGRDAQWPTVCAHFTVLNYLPESEFEAGEIDIIEGVHDNVHNQVTWHTLPGCNLETPGNFTGTPVVSRSLFIGAPGAEEHWRVN